MYWLKAARLTFAFLIVLSAAGLPLSSTQALSSEGLKSELLLGLMQPLPITIIGPLMVAEVEIESDGDMFQINLPQAKLMGMIPLGDVSFSLNPLTDDTYEISNFVLPKQVPLPGGFMLGINESSLEGIWSSKNRSYETMRMALSDLTVTAGGGAAQLAKIKNLVLEIDQQDKRDKDVSRFALTVDGVDVDISKTDQVDIDRVRVNVEARTDQVLDLQSMLSQALQSAFLGGDSSRLMTLLDVLRNRQYEKLHLMIAADHVRADLNVDGEDLKIMSDYALVQLRGLDLSQDRAGSLSFKVDAVNTLFNNEDLNTGVDSLNAEINLASLEIGKALDAITKIQLARNGTKVDGNMADLYDAFMGFKRLSLAIASENVRFQNPSNKDLEEFGLKALELSYALNKFDQLKGIVLSKLLIDSPVMKFPEIEEGNAEALLSATMRDDILNMFMPQYFEGMGSLTGFGDDLIRKTLENMPINANLDTNLLALVAVLPTLELKVDGKSEYRTAMVDLKTDVDLTIVPMRVLSLNPYTGNQYIQIGGWDAFVGEGRRLIEVYADDAEIDKWLIPIVAAVTAFAKESDDKHIWSIDMDGAKDFVEINGRKFYMGNMLMSGSMLPSFFMMSRFGALAGGL